MQTFQQKGFWTTWLRLSSAERLAPWSPAEQSAGAAVKIRSLRKPNQPCLWPMVQQSCAELLTTFIDGE